MKNFEINHIVILELQMLKRDKKDKSLTEPGHRELPGHAAGSFLVSCALMYHMYQVRDCCPSLTINCQVFHMCRHVGNILPSILLALI